MDKALYKICLCAFKYMPILGAFILMLHCILLWCGVHVKFVGMAVGTSLWNMIVLGCASYAFRFCSLHRHFIVYGFLVTLCINYQAAVGFGEWRNDMHGVMSTAGILLFVTLIIKKGQLECGKMD